MARLRLLKPRRVDAFGRLKALGEEKLARVEGMLIGGHSLKDVAEFIQEDLKDCLDIKRSSVEKTLDRYRNTELRERLLLRVAEAATGRNVSTVARNVNAIESLTELVSLQQERFTYAYQQEATIRERTGSGNMMIMLNKVVTSEAVVLQRMLVDLGALQLETGVIQRAPKRVIGRITDPAGDIREFSWTEEQDKLYQELENTIDAEE